MSTSLPKELRAGSYATSLLVRVRTRHVSRTARAGIAAAFLVYLLTIVGASYFGSSMRRYAEATAGSSADAFWLNFVLALRKGNLGTVGVAALASVIIATLIGPISGAAGQTLVSSSEATGLRLPRLHRYFDSWVTTVVSPLGLTQFLTLTLLAGLLTLDGGRTAAMTVVWLLWVTLMAASVTLGWGVEYAMRVFSRTTRIILTAALLAGLAAATLADPHHGSTLFGAADGFSAVLFAGTQHHLTPVLLTCITLIVLSAAFVAGGVMLCRCALAHPALVPAKPRTRARARPWPTNPMRVGVRVAWIAQWRTRVARRSVTVLGVVAAAGLLAAHAHLIDIANVLNTVVFTLPLSVALGWGVNMFGVIGSGMTWLLTQPAIGPRLAAAATTTQIGSVVLQGAMFAIPAWAIGGAHVDQLLRFGLALTAAAALVGVSCARMSVLHPMRARLAERGDAIVPPVRSVNYTLRLLVAGTLPGMLLAGSGWPLPVIAALTLAAVAAATFRYQEVARLWADPAVRARVAASVT